MGRIYPWRLPRLEEHIYSDAIAVVDATNHLMFVVRIYNANGRHKKINVESIQRRRTLLHGEQHWEIEENKWCSPRVAGHHSFVRGVTVRKHRRGNCIAAEAEL
eukprot:Gb_34791 [translate_table: standard]